MYPSPDVDSLLNTRVLLLNATYEIIGTISVARAIHMSMRHDNPVSVEEFVPGRVLRSAGGREFAVPSVVVLKHFVNIRRRRQESGTKRMKIYFRDRHQCQYCSVRVGKKHPELGRVLVHSDLTLDHITPKSRGGSSLPSNLVTCCIPCNQRKADRTPDEARMPLRTEVHEITEIGLDRLLICKYVEHRKEWIPYLAIQEEFKPILSEMGFLEQVA